MMAKLRVERVEEADRQKVCDLARLAHEESIFSEIPFSEAKFYKALDNTLEEPSAYLGLKVTLDDAILGYCYAMLGGYYIGDGAKVVTVISIFVDQNVRSSVLGGKVTMHLMRGIEKWGREEGASFVMYHVTSGTDVANVDRFFRKMGMTTLGGNYGNKL